jgi:hypothetical protein
VALDQNRERARLGRCQRRPRRWLGGTGQNIGPAASTALPANHTLTFSTLFSVEQPSIAEENEPQRTQRTQIKKPIPALSAFFAFFAV